MRTRSGRVVALIVLLLTMPGWRVAASEDAEGDPLKLNARYQNGFMLSTEDGRFSLRLTAALQMRYTYLAYDDRIQGNDEDFSSFFVRRARLWWDGHVYDPDITYSFHLQLEPATGVNLHDAWVQYRFSDLFSVGLGRNKIPYGTEFLASGFSLNFVDRSIMYGETEVSAGGGASRWPGGNLAFSLAGENPFTGFPLGGLSLYRSQGISASGRRDFAGGSTVRYEAGVWQGRNTRSGSNPADDHLFAARLGYYPFGFLNWASQGDPEHTERFRVGLLASVYTDESLHDRDASGAVVPGYRARDTGSNLSILIRYRGFSSDLEWGAETYDLDRDLEGPSEFDREAWRASFGYFVVRSKVEVVARYARVCRLKNPTPEAVATSGLGFVSMWNGDEYVEAIEDELSEITTGLNIYLGRALHQHKLFFDVSRLARSFVENDGFKPEDQEDLRFRTMLQLKF